MELQCFIPSRKTGGICMKKGMLFIVSLCAIGLINGVALADRTTYDQTKTRVAMPLPQPPVIDGVLDWAGGESWLYAGGYQPTNNSYWALAFDMDKEDFIRGGNLVSGLGPWDETDFGAKIWTGYDDDYLYVAVQVVDDWHYDDTAAAGSANGRTWLDDSVEIFIDGDNSNYDQRDTAGARPEGWSTGGQYVVTTNNAYRDQEAGSPGMGENKLWYGVCGVDPNSAFIYVYEFRISWDLLGGKPAQGEIIGFDVAINDDDDGGDTLENQYTWAGLTHVESTYGNLVIGPRQYEAPQVSTAPSIDGTIQSGEYGDAEAIQLDHYSVVYCGDDEWAIGDHDYSAWVVHDNSAIYVAVEVTDDVISTDSAAAGSEDGQTWLDDSVEILIDSNASDDLGRTATNLYEGQFVMTPNGAYRDNEANNPTFGENDDWYAVAATTSTGYIIEYKIMKNMLFELKDVIGFDIAVNDDDADGRNRKTQISWNGWPHNESSYGELILKSSTDITNWSLF
jgi:hypothetical protein